MLFRYPGSKAKRSALAQIKAIFPTSFSTYREPFVGGGSVAFSIDPSIPRWVNDANTSLIAVYRALRDRPEEFTALCQTISPMVADEEMIRKASGAQYPARLARQFESLLADETADPALRYLFLNRCSWNGRVMLAPGRRSRTYFSNPKGWNQAFFRTLTTAARLLGETKITSDDFETVFDASGNDVLIFADPPYVKDTYLAKSAKLYEMGFTVDDHYRLRACIERCSHKVILTYDDDPLIRSLYKDFCVREASWTYSGRADRMKGQELIICNYDPVAIQESLFFDAA